MEIKDDLSLCSSDESDNESDNESNDKWSKNDEPKFIQN